MKPRRQNGSLIQRGKGAWRLLLVLLFALLPLLPLRAVLVSGSYLTTDPGDTTNTGLSAWDYVGSLNGASATYLGNGWVITAAHVGATVGEGYSLDGYSYTVSSVAGAIGTSDLFMFQISGTNTAASNNLLSLGTLAIDSSTPSVNSTVLMIGYGGGSGETYGTSTVTQTGQSVTPPGTSYVSTDYYLYNNGTAYVVSGDSGGAGFAHTGGTWTLSGLLEVQLTYSGSTTTYGSGLVDLSQYATQINALVATSSVPEPSSIALILIGTLLLFAITRAPRRKAQVS